ncbi:MAG: Uncharacterised protein [Puniceicoccaceae bacterium MED-G32]|nr:MAG: Uncharacterised protein [Puniceicoccaceae bacterium MED-G32]
MNVFVGGVASCPPSLPFRLDRSLDRLMVYIFPAVEGHEISKFSGSGLTIEVSIANKLELNITTSKIKDDEVISFMGVGCKIFAH